MKNFYLIQIEYLDGEIVEEIIPAELYNEKLEFDEIKKNVLERNLTIDKVKELTNFDPEKNEFIKK